MFSEETPVAMELNDSSQSCSFSRGSRDSFLLAMSQEAPVFVRSFSPRTILGIEICMQHHDDNDDDEVFV